jgi:RTX calcium-binding nonapeptide repeat (4 copies)
MRRVAMLRVLGVFLGTSLALAPAALAAEVSGVLVPCRDAHECRYVLGPSIGATFQAAPGEVNRVGTLFVDPIAGSRSGLHIHDAGAPIATGDYCDSLGEHEARCAPRPGEWASGVRLEVRTGDQADVVFPEVGTLYLGPGDDTARGSALIYAGKGDDDLRARSVRPDGSIRQLGMFHGGPGRDVLVGGSKTDLLHGGRGDDRLVGGEEWYERLRGGPGDDRIAAADGERDVVRCGPGRDRVRVDSLDRVRGCERVILARRG